MHHWQEPEERSVPHDPGALRQTASDTSVLSTRIKPLGFLGLQAPDDPPARRDTSDDNPPSVDSFPREPKSTFFSQSLPPL